MLLPGLAYFFGPEYSLGAVALLLIAAAWYRLRSGVEGYFNDFASTVLVIAYVPLLIGFATAMSGEDLGAEMVISMILLTAGNDTGGYFAGTNVEAVLQELAAKDIGYQAHGNMGSTETFDPATGWHSGTFDAACTFTFSASTTGCFTIEPSAMRTTGFATNCR